MLISTRCIHGFMSNLIKKSLPDSSGKADSAMPLDPYYSTEKHEEENGWITHCYSMNKRTDFLCLHSLTK